MQKTVYVTEEQMQKIMAKGDSKSFTKRIVELALLGATVEDIINNESSERVTELINKGYLYEQSREPKVNLKLALGYFNSMYRKKYPNEPLP